MKNQTKALFYLSALALLFILSGCTKYVAGPKGETGAPGKNGNMVQTTIGPLTKTPTDWTFDGTGWNTSVFVIEINDDVINKGEVKGYIKIGNEWRSLPYAYNGDIFTQMSIGKTEIRLQRREIHGGPPPAPDVTSFRFVVFAPVL
jgi:hypothetical protein